MRLRSQAGMRSLLEIIQIRTLHSLRRPSGGLARQEFSQMDVTVVARSEGRNAGEQMEDPLHSRARIGYWALFARTISRKSCCTRVSAVISGWNVHARR